MGSHLRRLGGHFGAWEVILGPVRSLGASGRSLGVPGRSLGAPGRSLGVRERSLGARERSLRALALGMSLGA